MLVNIINDVLDLSKIEAGKLDIQKTNIDIVDLMMDTASLLGLQAQEKGLTLSISTEGNIPKMVHTDPLRLKQILLNIIGNAIKYTEKGGIKVVLKLVPEDNENKIAVFVTDTGPGI